MRCAKVLGATWPPVIVIVVIVDALIFLDLVKSKVTALKNVVKNALKKRCVSGYCHCICN